MRWWSWPLLLLAAKIDEKPELASEQLARSENFDPLSTQFTWM